jgi:hypothetical protein
VAEWLAETAAWLERSGVGPVVGFAASLLAIAAAAVAWWSSWRAKAAAEAAEGAVQIALARLGRNDLLSTLAQLLGELETELALMKNEDTLPGERLLRLRGRMSELEESPVLGAADRAILVDARGFMARCMEPDAERADVRRGLANQHDELRKLLARLRNEVRDG